MRAWWDRLWTLGWIRPGLGRAKRRWRYCTRDGMSRLRLRRWAVDSIRLLLHHMDLECIRYMFISTGLKCEVSLWLRRLMVNRGIRWMIEGSWFEVSRRNAELDHIYAWRNFFHAFPVKLFRKLLVNLFWFEILCEFVLFWPERTDGTPIWKNWNVSFCESCTKFRNTITFEASTELSQFFCVFIGSEY